MRSTVLHRESTAATNVTKGKERKRIYIAPFIYTMYISKRSRIDHTVYTMLAFLS